MLFHVCRRDSNLVFRNGILFGAQYNGMYVFKSKPQQLDTDRISMIVFCCTYYLWNGERVAKRRKGKCALALCIYIYLFSIVFIENSISIDSFGDTHTYIQTITHRKRERCTDSGNGNENVPSSFFFFIPSI